MTTLDPTPVVDLAPEAEQQPGRGWAAAGVAAAVLTAVGLVANGTAGYPTYDKELAGDAPAIVRGLADNTVGLLTFHVTTMVSALLMLVVAAGMLRHLRATTPAASLIPTIAFSGLLLVSVAQLIGTGLDTEFIFGVKSPELFVPETVDVYGHWIGTVPWLWVGAGVAALAVGVAGLRHQAVGRPTAVISLVLGGFITLLGVGPLQYAAAAPGPLWLLIVSVAILRRRTA